LRIVPMRVLITHGCRPRAHPTAHLAFRQMRLGKASARIREDANNLGRSYRLPTIRFKSPAPSRRAAKADG
jgi:hypothetical protein